jgi:hypothetical protein
MHACQLDHHAQSLPAPLFLEGAAAERLHHARTRDITACPTLPCRAAMLGLMMLVADDFNVRILLFLGHLVRPMVTTRAGWSAGWG